MSIISVEEYLEHYGEKDQTYKYKKEDIRSCITYTSDQIESICDYLYKCWEETDKKSIYYRNEKEKEHIKKAFFLQTKYNLDNGNDLKQETNYSYSSGSINFSENKRKREEILTSVINHLQKARVYRSIKNEPTKNLENISKEFNKIISKMLEICDRRYVSLSFDNDNHLIHTYKNKVFDVLPISELSMVINNQIYTDIQNLQNNIQLLTRNLIDLEARVKALEENE